MPILEIGASGRPGHLGDSAPVSGYSRPCRSVVPTARAAVTPPPTSLLRSSAVLLLASAAGALTVAPASAQAPRARTASKFIDVRGGKPRAAASTRARVARLQRAAG